MRTVTLTEVDAELVEFDWSKIDALTDEQLERAAAEDPDNPDTSAVPAENWQKFFTALDVKALRRRLKMSQKDFALTYRISKPVLEYLESPKQHGPFLLQGALSVYLALIAAYPKDMARMIESLDRQAKSQAQAAE